ncbi:MAG TPA: DUF1232 domain-containing protein [Thermoanaerobaculia bacterium]|nr:DUF1232 domain-containing protein [Thermoanaerobaculia bacterium]
MSPSAPDASRPDPDLDTPTPGDARAEERLLRFYDRLRRRVAGRVASRVGERSADILLLAPDLFILLVRLFLDPRVPAATRSLVGGALAYFVLPADLLPEIFLGVGGFLDDVVLAGAVVSHVFSSDLRPFVERHWSGRHDAQAAIEDAVRAGEALLPSRLYERLARVLARHGVDLGRAPRPGSLGLDSATTDDETYDYSRVT